MKMLKLLLVSFIVMASLSGCAATDKAIDWFKDVTNYGHDSKY